MWRPPLWCISDGDVDILDPLLWNSSFGQANTSEVKKNSLSREHRFNLTLILVHLKTFSR